MESGSTASTQDHVRDFLHFAESPQRFARIARLAVTAAEQDSEVRENLAAIGRWVAEPRGKESLRTEESINDIVPVLYLRAQDGIRGARLSSARSLRQATRRARERLESLEPDFVNELLQETRSRVTSQSLVARRIELTRTELAEITPELEQIADELVPLLSAAEDSGRTGNETSSRIRVRCQLAGVDVSCWLYVAVVVAVVIIKL